MNPQHPGQQSDEREFQSRMIAHCLRRGLELLYLGTCYALTQVGRSVST